MCGIVGLFLKDASLEPDLGNLLSEMLITMTDRGPDSAGIAIYGDKDPVSSKFTIQSDDANQAFEGLSIYIIELLSYNVDIIINDNLEVFTNN